MALIPDLAEFKKSLAALPVLTVEAGQTVLAAGSTTGQLYILRHGVVEIVRDGHRIATVSEPGVVFGELASAEGIVITYAASPDRLTAALAAQVERYNPATELVVVCFGRLDDRRAQVRPRAYVYRYLTPSA